MLGHIGAEITGPEAACQVPAQIGVGLPNPRERGLDRLGDGQPGALCV
ncbi:MAG: hypothetical protein JO071_12575 [Deltaproteobacteria bacterium]|nr:hypothetical protein [Deltaproteobacteria bacterium]